jgi:hypothetical protein
VTGSAHQSRWERERSSIGLNGNVKEPKGVPWVDGRTVGRSDGRTVGQADRRTGGRGGRDGRGS